jgi:hypothetical protein
MRVPIRVALLLVPLAAPASAGPCVPGSLANYQGLGTTGCTIGEFAFKGFDFDVVLTAGGATAIGASDIWVSPGLTAASMILNFASTGFAVSGFQAVRYDISYIVDPPPVIINGFEDRLETFTPVAPGEVDVLTNVCTSSGTCPPGTIASLYVYHDGYSSDPHDAVSFPLTNYLAVSNLINLQANGATADFSSLSNQVNIVPQAVPESASLVFTVSGVLALAMGRRRARPSPAPLTLNQPTPTGSITTVTTLSASLSRAASCS